MSFALTLISSTIPLSAGHLADVLGFLAERNMGTSGEPKWLDRHKAADIMLTDHLPHEDIVALRELLAEHKIDVLISPQQGRKKKLVLADMDSTIVTSETLDEIAAKAGIADKIVPITERAMRGELNFEQALRERVGYLKNLPSSILNDVLAETELTEGAQQFVSVMAANGAQCVLVSGGFTFFTEAIAKQAGFQTHHGNTLDVENGKLSGTVSDPILGREAKLGYLNQYKRALDIRSEETLAIGDGSNDLAMLEAAGLGIGFHPKPLLLEKLDNCIIHGDLTAALYAQGYSNFIN